MQRKAEIANKPEKLKSFVGSAQHLGKLTTNVSQIWYPLRSFVKNITKDVGTENCGVFFQDKNSK